MANTEKLLQAVTLGHGHVQGWTQAFLRDSNAWPGGCGRVQEGVGGYGRVREDVGGCGRVQEGAGGYERVREGAGGYERVQEGAGGYERVQEGTGGWVHMEAFAINYITCYCLHLLWKRFMQTASGVLACSFS